MLRRESAASLTASLCAPSSRPRARTTRPRPSSSKRRRATRRPLRRRPPASARACRSRPRSAGRASPRSSARAQAALAAELDAVLARRGRDRVASHRRRPRRACSRCAARRSGSACVTSRRSGCSPSCGVELAEAQHTRRAGPSPAELGRAADEADAAARTAVRERDDLEARVRLARERLAALEQSLAEREGIPPAARALAEEGERLALQLLEVEPGAERSTAAALGHRASAVLAASPERGLELVAKAQAAGLGSVLVLVGQRPARARAAAGRPARRAARLARPGRHERRHRLGPAARRALVRGRDRRGRAARARGAPPRAARRGRRARRPRRRAARARVEEAAERALRGRGEAFAPVAHLRNVRRADPRALERLVAGAERLDETLAGCGRAPRAGSRRRSPSAPARLAEELRGIATREAELRRAVAEADGARARRRAPRERAHRRGRGRRRRRCAREAEELSARAAEAAEAADDAAERARAAARALADADPARTRRPSELVLERLRRRAARARGRARRRRRPLRGARARARRGAGGAHDRARRRAAHGSAPPRSSCARRPPPRGERLSAIDVELARTDAERDEAQRRLDAAGAEPAEGEDRDELAEKLARYEQPPRAARPGQPAREGGVRRPRRCGSRSSPCSATTSSRASPSSRSCATT